MPTFTAIALDRLLEPGASRSLVKSGSDMKSVQNSKLERRNSTSTVTSKPPIEKKYHWAQISPALYATPEATPLPDSPSSFPPSPYIVNHKRRGPRLLKSSSEADVSSRKQAQDEEKVNGDVTDAKIVVDGLNDSATADANVNDVSVPESIEVDQVTGLCVEGIGSSGLDNGLAKENESLNYLSLNPGRDGDCEGYYDPQETMSFSSNTEGEDVGNTERSVKLGTPSVEFYDAWEELSSEGASQSSLRDVDAELREIRLSLLMEIEKRKQAEESLNNVRSQWQHVREHLASAGLIVPPDPTVVGEDEQLDCDTAADLCQQVYLARFVSESIGRGMAKAEAEMEMEAQVEAKNFEIARLLDRLHYYEAVNREMSQRNQEAVEMARRDWQRRKRRQRWVWGSIAATITLGTAALVWSYFPSENGLHSANHSQAPKPDDAAK